MLSKDKVKESLENLPDRFSLDELIDRLLVIEKTEEATQQIEAGEFFTEEEVDKEIDSWFE